MKDSFGRDINYLRISVTDRCDLRCQYCMAEKMQFLPRNELLTLEELSDLSLRFIDKGIRKIRISGGEPLMRRDVMSLFEVLGQKLGDGLEELTLTTNGTQLSKYADRLAQVGVKRINVSLDSLDASVVNTITRRACLPSVLEGISAAQQAGLKVKINTVLLPENRDHIVDMVAWCHERGHDLSLIEIMPMGQTDKDRRQQFLPMQLAKEAIAAKYTLREELQADPLGGPSRYFRVLETRGRVGFISPLTNNFCANCNRIRLTCMGRIYMCLGQEDHVDLKSILRTNGNIDQAIAKALRVKPEAHDFSISDKPSISRHMSVTGG